MVEYLDENLVDVHIGSTTDQVYGTIMCAVCKENGERNQKPQRVFYHSNDDRSYWVLSNFHKHLKTVHNFTQLTDAKRQSREKRKNIISDVDNTNIAADEEQTTIPPENAAEKSLSIVADNAKSTGPSKGDAEKYENSIDDEKSFTNQSEYDSEIYIVDESGDVIQQQSEETMKHNNVQFDNRNSWLHHQFSSQILQMAETTLMNNDPQEIMSIKIENERILVTVAKIPGDGFCLFGALAHQLFHHPINSTEHKKATKSLKSEVVQYILDNILLFEFILKDRVYDIKRPDEITDMRTECKLFVRYSLDKKGWAVQKRFKPYQTNTK